MTLSAQGRSSTEILPVLGLFAAGAFRIAPSVNRILNAVQQIQFAVPAISGLSSDLRSPQIQMQVDNTDRLSKFQSLEWNDVSFSYDAASIPVLSSVSLKIEAGDVIGVVGGSGAGKSTFVDLCLGLYPPTFGTILLNGHEVDTRLSDWHQMVGYVPQQVYLSDSSVKANVCLGLPDDQIDNERLLLSLGMAQLGEWIEHLEDGFEALVGENGARLSGGQQQRIGIARALYNLPQVLFFDEATSALDTDTENALIDSIDLLKSKFTIVIVTHREGPLRLCNKVLSLANGVAKWR
jgi:ABC-type bacteriocin/lantibiotic exporter with double-glycine peptidase domain